MKNREARNLLKEIYGDGCFMERAGIRIRKAKTLDRTISYHHLKRRCDGGETSIENGANLANYNHQWLHEQSEKTQREINQILKDFKYRLDLARLEINENRIKIKKIDLDSINSEIITIPAFDNSKLSEKEYYRLMYLRKKANNSIYKRKEEEYER